MCVILVVHIQIDAMIKHCIRNSEQTIMLSKKTRIRQNYIISETIEPAVRDLNININCVHIILRKFKYVYSIQIPASANVISG